MRNIGLGSEWGNSQLGASFLDKIKSQATQAVAGTVAKQAVSAIDSSGISKTAADATVMAKNIAEKALVVADKGLVIGKQVAMGVGAVAVLYILYKFYEASRTRKLKAEVSYLEMKGVEK